MLALVQASNAVTLRVARLAAWIKTRDPAELGYSSHGALFRQHVTWSDSRLRALIRLVESDLHAVKAAACLGLLPITTAAKGVGAVDPDQQGWWLEGGRRGDRGMLPTPRRRGPGVGPKVVRTVDLEGAELRAIHGARQLARLLAGQPLSEPVADRLVLDCWWRRADGKDLLRRARRSPPPPPQRSPPSWCDVPDPATRILGEWREPRDLAHALRLLEHAQVARGSRELLLGQAFDCVASRALYWEMGFHSLRALAEDGLDCSVRALERHRLLALDLRLLAPLAAAIDDGLDLARARLVASIACEDTALDWIRVARHTGIAELERAVRLANGGSSKKVERQVLAGYHRAIRLAEQLAVQPGAGDATEAGAAGQAGDATKTGAVGLAGLRLFVSLNAAWAPPPVPRFDRVHADLPEAAAWFLENVRIEPQRGIGKVKEKADCTCRNPECGCRNLRVQTHHLVWVSLGGSDEEDNLICVCKPCHLRLIHTGIVSVTRVGGALVWRYPGRVVVAL